jgi:predicted permease
MDDRRAGESPVLVISDRLWQTRFASDPGVIGQKVKVNGFPYTIIGVAAPRFVGTELILSADFWVPLSMSGQIEPASQWTQVRISQNLWALGRLKTGVPWAQAEADLDNIVRRIAREYPEDVQASTKIHLSPTGLVGKAVRDPIATFSFVLLTIAGTGLLLACVNVAGMALARSSTRQSEIGIRLAIGASRGQILRQLLTETLLIAICGGAVGIAFAALACQLLSSVHFDFGIPFAAHLSPNPRVLAFASVITLLTTLVFGLLPALQTVRKDVAPGLRDHSGGQKQHRGIVREMTVSVQVALSLILVICSLLVVRSLQRALDLNLGLKPDGAFAMTTDLRSQGYDEARSHAFRHDLLSRVAALPGIQSVGIINSLPLNLAGLEGDFYSRADRPLPPPGQERVALIYNVSPGYFRTAGTRLLFGRDISIADQKGTLPVGILNEAAAEQLFPNESPLGQGVRITTDPKDRGFQIVGVVETGKYRFLSDNRQPVVFLPIDQMNAPWATLVVRSRMQPGELASLLRRTALEINPELTLFQAGTLQEQLALPLFPARVAAFALGSFGALALVLAATGLFALVAFAVARRAREIGIRIALGATSKQVLLSIFQRTALFCGAGAVIGIAVTLFASKLLSAVLYGVDPHDAPTYAISIMALGSVALLACWTPARRAIRLDPARTLREE